MHKKGGKKRRTRPHHPAAPRGDNKLQLKKNFLSASRGAEAAALPRCGSRQGRGVLAAPRAPAPSPAALPQPGLALRGTAGPEGGLLLHPGGRRGCVCVCGERVNLSGLGEETKGFFRGRGTHGVGRSFGKGSPVRRGGSGSGERLQRAAGRRKTRAQQLYSRLFIKIINLNKI